MLQSHALVFLYSGIPSTAGLYWFALERPTPNLGRSTCEQELMRDPRTAWNARHQPPQPTRLEVML